MKLRRLLQLTPNFGLKLATTFLLEAINMRRMTRWSNCFYSHCLFTFSVIILVFVFSSIRSGAASFWVETSGNVRVSRQTTDGREISEGTYTTPVSVRLSDDGRFIIRLLNHQFYKRREIVFSFDGTNYFYLIGKGNETRLGDSKKAADFGMDLGMCYLSAEEMPLVLIEDHARDALWYALGSGNYFKKHGETGEIPDLFFSPRRSIVGYGYRYKVSLTKPMFCVPYSLDLWRDKQSDRKGGIRDTEEDRLELDTAGRGTVLYDNNWSVRRAIPDGRHVMSLLWKRDCIVEEQKLPIEVEITDFYTWGASSNACVRVKLEFEAWHTSAVDRNESFRPDPTQPMKVLDARVRMRKEGHYLDDLVYSMGTSPTNSTWRATNDPWIQHAVAEVSAAQPIPGQKGKASRVLMLVLLFGVVSPIFVFLISKRRPYSSGKIKPGDGSVTSVNKQN